MAGEDLPAYALPVSWILLIIQTLIIFGLIMAVRGIRRRNMDLHHRIVYPAIVLQYLMFFGWMGPGLLTMIRNGLLQQPLQEIPIVLHVIFGSIALIGSLYLVIYWVVLQKEVNDENLKFPVIVMKITLLSWVLAYLLGLWVFVHIYY